MRGILWWLTLSFALVACTSNIFESTAQTSATDAQLFAFKRNVDLALWDDAIAAYANLTPAQQATREVGQYIASAYAGRCGLEFVVLVNNISSGTGNLLNILLQAMPDATQSMIDDCVVADTKLKALGVALGDTQTEHIMNVVLGLATVGSLLNLDGADVTNHLSATFNPCLPAQMSDAHTQQLVASMATVFSHIASAGLTSLGSSMGNVTTLCNDPLISASGMCTATTAASVTAQQICAMRAIVNESQNIGLGVCTGDLVACACGGCAF